MFMVQSQAVEVTLYLSMMIYGISLSHHHHQACLDLLIIMLLSFMDCFYSQYYFRGPFMNIIICKKQKILEDDCKNIRILQQSKINLSLQDIIMGNAKLRPGMFIITRKKSYQAGQPIQGTVYLNLPNPYPISRIILTIKGYEKVSWNPTIVKQHKQNQNDSEQKEGDNTHQPQIVVQHLKTNSNSKAKRKNEDQNENREGVAMILNQDKILLEFNDEEMMQGQYQFPFKLLTCSYIPGSFQEQTKLYKAQIRYQLSCIAISTNNKFRDLIQQKQITISGSRKRKQKYEQVKSMASTKAKANNNQNMNINNSNLTSKSSQSSSYFNDIKYVHKCAIDVYTHSCCCFNTQHVKVQVGLQQQCFQAGSQCEVLVSVDTVDSSDWLKQLWLSFNKQVTLGCSTGQQIKFSQILQRSMLPPTPPNSKYSDKIRLTLNYPETQIGLAQTVKGNLIKCRYWLQIRCKMGGCCKDTNQNRSMKLRIVERGQEQQQIERPKDWNPIVYQKSSIIMQEVGSNFRLDTMKSQY